MNARLAQVRTRNAVVAALCLLPAMAWAQDPAAQSSGGSWYWWVGAVGLVVVVLFLLTRSRPTATTSAPRPMAAMATRPVTSPVTSPAPTAPAPLVEDEGDVDYATVRHVSLAFEWGTRTRLQSALAALDLSTPEERYPSSVHAAALLWESLDGARFFAAESRIVPARLAASSFEAEALELRARRVAATAERPALDAGPAYRASAPRGDGFFVVTLLTVSFPWLAPLPVARERRELAAALDQFNPTDPAALFGVELVWSPADEYERLSEEELAALHPELRPLLAGPVVV